MTHIDTILALIDTGLQTAGDIAYGDDRQGCCWRCRSPRNSDLCAQCREELLAEVEVPVPVESEIRYVGPPGLFRATFTEVAP